jgi:hypothetical protein
MSQSNPFYFEQWSYVAEGDDEYVLHEIKIANATRDGQTYAQNNERIELQRFLANSKNDALKRALKDYIEANKNAARS